MKYLVNDEYQYIAWPSMFKFGFTYFNTRVGLFLEVNGTLGVKLIDVFIQSTPQQVAMGYRDSHPGNLLNFKKEDGPHKKLELL